MRKGDFKVIIQLVMTIFSIQLGAQSQSQFLPSGNICNNSSYKLVFSDEFNGNSLDLSKWKTYYPDGPNGSDQCSFCRTHSTLQKQEGQIYRDENVSVSNGTAKLTVKREAGTWYEFNKDFTSGMIYSTQSFNTFTKFEIKCKLPSGCGFWSAFWVFGWSTEIDVFEHGCIKPNKYECSVHHSENSCNTWKALVTPNVDLSSDFHTYTAEYEPNWVKFYFDGQLKLTMPKYYVSNGQALTSCDIPAGFYFLEPEFPVTGNPINIIANVAVGLSNNDGDPLTPYTGAPTQSTVLPQSMEIDYIRAYQRQPQSDLSDICKEIKINGPSSLCFSNDKMDTLMYCVDEPSNKSLEFATSNNIEIVQNPAYELSIIDTTIIINGIEKDTFYIDTIYHYGCVRISPKTNTEDGFGTISISVNDESCGMRTFDLPVEIGIPTPIINLRLNDPCTGLLILRTPDYNINLLDIEVFNKGNLMLLPQISNVSSDGVYINLPKQRIFDNSFFYIKMTITSSCGEREIIYKVLIPNSKCRNIEYRVSSNPTNGIVNIQLNDDDMIFDILKIYVKNSQNGNTVLNCDNIISQNDLTLDLTNIPSGNYIVTVENTEGQLFSNSIQIVR